MAKIKGQIHSSELPAEYFKFVAWISLPKAERKPRLQRQFARENHITEQTLVNWKKREGFWDMVREQIKHWSRDDLGEVIDAIKKGAINLGLRGQPANAKLFLEWVDGFVKQQRISIHDETKEARAASLLDLYNAYDEPSKDSKTTKRSRKSGNKPNKRSSKTKTSNTNKKSES